MEEIISKEKEAVRDEQFVNDLLSEKGENLNVFLWRATTQLNINNKQAFLLFAKCSSTKWQSVLEYLFSQIDKKSADEYVQKDTFYSLVSPKIIKDISEIDPVFARRIPMKPSEGDFTLIILSDEGDSFHMIKPERPVCH